MCAFVTSVASMFSRKAASAASRITNSNSAPVNRSVCSAHRRKSTSFASGTPCACTLSASSRPAKSGGGTYRHISSRPGRISAVSRFSGRFVVATTRTFESRDEYASAPSSLVSLSPLLTSKPSISTRNADNTRAATSFPPAAPPSPPASPRLPTIPSISSSSRIEGAAFRAFANASRSNLSPSPTYFEKTSAALREITVAPDAFAAARASVVFAHPGGPCSSTPLGGASPNLSKLFACFKGHSTACCKRRFTSCSPPTSAQVVGVNSNAAPLVTDAPTFVSARAK
mmetsp:Transcript_2878/g.10959  ORF Transcript_2878/g.10959 Transcript_2878/m.10959 type:complete len:286 (+) Transcript_2878:253-1110(+)